MELTKIIRFAFGITGIILVGVILFYLWKLYLYLYFNFQKKSKTVSGQSSPPEEKKYRAPNFVYDTDKHEFYVFEGRT